MAKDTAAKPKLRFPVEQLSPDEQVLDAFPALRDHAALVEHGAGENDCLLRYAILMSEGTTLHRTFADFGERKRAALKLAGVAEDHPRYQGALDLTDPGVQILRWTWLKLFSSRKFRAYIAICAAYDQNCMKVEMLDKGADYAALAPQDELLNKLEHELFFGDEQIEQLAVEKVATEKPLQSWEDRIFKAKEAA